MVTELLALVDVGDVHLDDRALQRADAVVQGNARVGIGAGVQYNAIILSEAYLLQLL